MTKEDRRFTRIDAPAKLGGIAHSQQGMEQNVGEHADVAHRTAEPSTMSIHSPRNWLEGGFKPNSRLRWLGANHGHSHRRIRRASREITREVGTQNASGLRNGCWSQARLAWMRWGSEHPYQLADESRHLRSTCPRT